MEYAPWISFGIGILARIFVPWLNERRKKPSLGWDMRYVWPQILGVIVIGLALPLLVPDLLSVGELTPQNAWLEGYGAASLGRLGDKFITGHE